VKHLFLFLFALLGACTTKQPAPPGAPVQGIISAQGDTLPNITERMNQYGVPGVSVAVIKDYKIAWLRSWGIVDKGTGQPVTRTTLFQAGSISKPVAAYAALRFVQDGRLHADSNVNNYLKSWKLPDNSFTERRKVNLRHLLSHSGGITVHGFLGYSPDLKVPTLVQALNGHEPANNLPIIVDKAPGESWRYSGGGYCIMQQMLIDIDGRSFPDITKAIVFDPLAMMNSTYEQPLPADRAAFAATGYLPDHTQTKGKWHIYPEMAAAGLWTTAEDLATWVVDVQLSYQGSSSKVLSREMTQQFLTPISDRFGLGIAVESNDSTEIYFQHGGWDEGFSSKLIAHRDRGYGIVVLTNSNHPDFIEEVITAVSKMDGWKGYE
jgi:CubicO group peptidase (beta-lactamase class C family)